MVKKKDEHYLNKKIVVVKDVFSTKQAIILAGEYLIKERVDPLKIRGYIYIVGPTVSDLIIVDPVAILKKDKLPLMRKCTGSEWCKYFSEFIE